MNRKQYRIKSVYSYALLVPAILVYFVLIILPTIFTIFYSFTNWDFSQSNFVGLSNYNDLLTDPNLNIAFLNTSIFTVVTTVFKTLFGLLLALFLNGKLRSRFYLRTVFYLPAVMNSIAVGIMFGALFYPNGLVNGFFRAIGLGFLSQNWFTNIHLAIYSISAVEVWKWSGFTMVILLGGLQSIPNDYYEAADLDGASSMQKFKSITFPMLMPAINNAVVLNLIGGIGVFDIVQVTTGGGPGNATQVLNSIIYKTYGMNLQGEACAGNVILSVIICIVSLLTYTLIRKKEVEM
jgi:ABC-type sugar transport systems, permease components